MKAQVLKEPAEVERRPLLYSDVPVPVPGDDEVLIQVSACGICRADLHVVEGELPAERASVVRGHEVVGAIAELGAKAAKSATGTRVGVPWLHRTCGICEQCRKGRE